jgi:hypothetical protein
MTLQISKQNGTFLVNGLLNSTTIKSFMIYCGCTIAQNESVVINIDGITEMNNDGLEGIKELTAIAIRNNKTFSVIGNGNKDIHQNYNDSKVA